MKRSFNVGRIPALLIVLGWPTPSIAQECPPLAVGDSVRVTRTFWTLRPEFGLETRSRRVEFGRVTALSADSVTFDGAEGHARMAFADSVSVARLCLVVVPSERDPGAAAANGAIMGALFGAGVASCGLRDTLDWWEESDCDDDVGDVILGVAIGGALGFLIGLGWGRSGRGSTEWTWVEGRGEEGSVIPLAITRGPTPGSWSVAFRIRAR